MQLLLALAILAAVDAPVTGNVGLQAHHPDAVEIFTCEFDQETWDINYDGWPDKWQRQLGPQLPHYVPVAIEAPAGSPGNGALVVRLNGGGVRIESPYFSVSDKFSYKIEARYKGEKILFAKSQIRIELCDAEKRVIQTSGCPWKANTSGWTPIEIGPINPTNDNIHMGRLVFIIRPGERADLEGTIALDDIWIARLPKMDVFTDNPFNVYTDADEIEVTCELSGILESNPDIVFELLDASSHTLGENSVQLEGELITERLSKASEFVDTTRSRRAAYAGKTSWKPPIERPGFYRIRVAMQTSRGMLKRDVINVALVPPLERPPKGEFGWSLASADLPMSLDDLALLLPRVAVHWVKMPVWYGESQITRGEELVVVTEQLAAKDIEVVGVLDRPPAESELAKRLAADSAIVDALTNDSSTWMPLLDPVLTRLSLRVRWWQLGSDTDSSYSTLADVRRELARLRDRMFRFGQDVNLGIGWSWNQASVDGAKRPSWEFQQFSATPPLTGHELGAYLDEKPKNHLQSWVLIELLPRTGYDLGTRARDLVEQMLAAKIHGADAIFAARPFDDDVGLMTSRGTPSELLLPWRTTASLLGGAKYLGRIQLPGGSHNELFEGSDGDVVMVVWNDAAESGKPIEEVINLGENVRVVDVWGRAVAPKERDGMQVIEVERLPQFVRGLNAAATRWRMTSSFAVRNVPSIFGKAHANKIEITNTFPQGVGGVVEIHGPKGWHIAPDKIDFKLAAGESVSKPFEISLPNDADSGATPIRADFTIDADKQYHVSVFRELNVGDGEIDLEVTTRMDSDGALIVEQRMVNRGKDLVDFKCFLYTPGRRRQRVQVFRLGPNPDVKTYRLPNGADLVNQNKEFTLRLEEVDGSRVLNYHFMPEQ